MKHFGDITQLSGYDLPVVDVITGGSPCQDLSVAGKRAGLDGERSGLFMEQIRIIKEMRERDRSMGRSGYLVRPRYMVWENVPGAFSSNQGEDFRVVLEEICKVADKTTVVPRPEKGKWSSSGCILGDGWSVAWRLHDAQFWGVPQRRKRISLVADFGGLSAPEILFERKDLSGDPEPCGAQGEGTPERTEGSTGEPVFSIQGGGGEGGNNLPMIVEPICFRDDITIKVDGGGTAFTLGARDFKGVQCVSYQTVTGCLNQGAHPGSYNGQDAYNDMLVIDENSKHRQWATAQHGDAGTCKPVGLHARCPSNSDQRERERERWQIALFAA